jgi:hypothetical protein
VDTEFHVELPFKVRVRFDYTWIRLVCIGVYPPVSIFKHEVMPESEFSHAHTLSP